MNKILVALSVSLLLVAGCMTIKAGKDFDSSKITNIKNGVTTKSDLQQWFGYPYMTGIDNGDESWNYNFTQGSTGGNILTKDMYIVFDDSGVVKSYTFSTSFPKEMSLPK